MSADQSTVERWLPVPGWEGLYEVSDHGRVRSLDREVAVRGGRPVRRIGRMLSPCVQRCGHLGLELYREGRPWRVRVHVLVMLAFVGPRPDGACCRHLNGDPADNRAENLVWGTHTENMVDRVVHGQRPVHGESVYNAKLTDATVREARDLAAASVPISTIARRFGVDPKTVHAAVHRRTWAHVA